MKKIVLVFIFITQINAQQSYIDYVSPFHPVVSSKGMVVSQNNLSSDIGRDILNMGGNAVDAAVAVGFSLATTLPRAGNLGGGGFMLVYIKERNEVFFIDYRSSSPLNSNIKDIFNKKLPRDYKRTNFDLVKKGYKASAIPGSVAGLLDAHSAFGKLPLNKILEPVIKQAEEGISVTYDLHKAIESSDQLREDAESKKIYFINDQPLPVGSLMKRPDLASTFKEISKSGKSGFYKGVIAQKFIDAMKANNGFFTLEDLKTYKSVTTSPIVGSYRENLVFTAGPPSGGGVVLLTSLNMLSFFDLSKFGSNSAKTYHLLGESLRRGHNNRSHQVGDPSKYNVPIKTLLSKNRMKELAKGLNMTKATPSSKVKPLRVVNESRDTTHYSIVDRDGNAVSNTYTLGYSFGSGVTIPGTGILMNNQMNNFAYRYGDSSIQGRVASPGNKFEPGKRPMSTMAPSMVFNKEGQLTLITGSPGGSYIPAAILRVISGVVDFNLNIGEATMLPRVHKDWPYTGLDYENTISSDVISILDGMGHKPESNKTMGSTQSIHIVDGVRYGYADLRRPNAAVSIQ
ncbi:gamma-glutamyltransferase [Gammaproteobacteria bacterium]|jgi:gamma-glutamyltranspeptidase/glutathione hydrolase|nr:gamma-glutamyltransferase [Gammaproteobacteria bacterium]MDA9997991.1 gamma-glutamyltransferase [Gammaproteobacteria bacterium]MDC1124156.1 gamma-glutamyltransferase [Gammaproteobacteria bacterium]